MSFFAADPARWERVMLAAIGRLRDGETIDRDTAAMDLAYFQDRALRPYGQIDFPTVRELADRWRWRPSSVGDLVSRPETWGDPRKADEWTAYHAALTARRARGRTRAGQAPDDGRTSAGQAPDGGERSNADNGESAGRSADNGRTSGGREPDVVRALVLEAPSTQHPAPESESPLIPPLPLPAVPAAEPEAALPTEKPTRTRKPGSPKGEPTPADLDAWRACVDLWATINPGNAKILKPEVGGGRQLMDAIRKLGGPRMIARLRWAVVGDTWAARTARGAADRALSDLLPDRNGLVDRLDAEAEARGDTGAPPDPAVSTAATEAADAWIDLEPRLRRVNSGRWTNRPEKFGSPEGVDLADDREEHKRRWKAFVEADKGARFPACAPPDSEKWRTWTTAWKRAYQATHTSPVGAGR